MLIGQMITNYFCSLVIDFNAKEMIYHGVCCVNYQNKATHADMAMKKNWEKKLKEPLKRE